MTIEFVQLFDLWETLSGHNGYRVARLYPCSNGQAGGWADIAFQTDTKIQNRSGAYCGLTQGKIDTTNGAQNPLMSDSRFLIVINWEADTDTPSVDTRQGIVTPTMLTAFTTYFSTQLGFNISVLPSMASAIGKTRAAVIAAVLIDLKNLT